jgi:hypothetical protein
MLRVVAMQLLVAHQILIASAIALALVFALRSLVLFSHGGGGGDLALAAASIAVAGALTAYFRTVRARWVQQRTAGRR